MRIYQFITPSRIGGAEVHVLGLARKLAERGHDVTVVCPRGRQFTRELQRQGVRLWAPRIWGKLDFVTLVRLAWHLRREQVEVLHTHLSTASLIGGLAARLAGVPAVATVHGLNHRTCFMYARKIIAVSQAVRSHLASQQVPESRLRVIYNGVEVARYPEAAEAVSLRVSGRRLRAAHRPQEMLIGSVGRLSREKGNAYLIQAAAILCGRERLPVRVLLVGEGRQRRALEQEARRCGIADRVIFAGFQREVVPYQAALDVFCLPSLKEGLSLSALEAMALRKPVVASRVGGTPEVVADGQTGVLVEPANAEALAAALARLLRDPAQARHMGEAGRERVERVFDIEQMVDRIEQVYAEVSRSPDPPAK